MSLDSLEEDRGLKAPIHKMPSSSTMGIDNDEEDLTFDSPQEGAAHYREKYRRIMDMLDETRAELDDFQTSSKELEEELERELAATERQQAELKDRIQKLEAEKEEWKNKFLSLQKMHSSTTVAMQREMDNLRSERDKTLVALRDLEMGNDELERNERVAVSSLLDLESKYNRAIEEKTLLEGEVIHRQELEEECQRLKDDVRDANSEIAILRDQLSRSIPTPPSSVSMPMSPVQRAIQDEPLPEDNLALSNPDEIMRRPHSLHGAITASPGPANRKQGLTRSGTTSSIPTLSPAAKRYASRLADSPSGLSTLARSATSRNLVQSIGPGSPVPVRVRAPVAASGSVPLSVPTPGKAQQNANSMAKTRAMRLLRDFRSKLKTSEDKMESKVPKRAVSGPMPLSQSRRNISAASSATAPVGVKQAFNAPKDASHTPIPGDVSGPGAIFLSPNSWVMVSDEEDTPTNQPMRLRSDEPPSPLEQNFRAVSSSSTSSRPLPSRPGIPSPLAANLSRSTTSHGARPPSRATGSTLASQAKRAPSRQQSEHSDSRPMSPSFIPQPSRSSLRSPTPTFGAMLMASNSTPSTSRPSSRSAHRVLGKGLPPASKAFPSPQPMAMSVSTSVSTPSSALKRSSRRSSLGVAEAALPPTGIPAPSGRTPGKDRPISVPVFVNGTPPPVPRIPSAHLRASVSLQQKDRLGRDRDSRAGL